jgi:hypothetical protein
MEAADERAPTLTRKLLFPKAGDPWGTVRIHLPLRPSHLPPRTYPRLIRAWPRRVPCRAQEELANVCHWMRQAIGVLCGITWGIARFEGWFGILTCARVRPPATRPAPRRHTPLAESA